MAPGTEIANFSILYKDAFSWEWLYKMIHEWLNSEGWDSYSKGDKWKEDNFIQRNLPFGKEVWVWWRVKKGRGKYIATYLDVEYHILGMKDTEVMHEGKKLEVQKGEVEVFIRAHIELNDAMIRKVPFMNSDWKLEWFKKRWYRKEIDQEEARLYDDAFRLQHAIKQYFDLRGWMGEYAGKPFIPKKGFT